MQPLLAGRQPISNKLEVRSEFSGATTAEGAITAAVQLYNCSNADPVQVTVASVSDWEPAALRVAELNHPQACRFKDVMNLANPALRQLLTDDLTEKATLIAYVTPYVVTLKEWCLVIVEPDR